MLTAMAVLTGLVGAAGTAQAQDHYYGDADYGDRYDRGYYQPSDHDGRGWRGICSGARAHQLEDRLADRVREGAISRYEAGSIQGQIDTYEHYQNIACSGGDYRQVPGFEMRYDRLEYRTDHPNGF
jgi:hypothetical protein